MKVLPDSVPAFIWYKDRENRILRANRLAAESRGMSIEEVEGRSVYDLYPEEAEKYYRDDLEVIRSGTPKLGIVEVLTTASGEKRWVRTDKIPYRSEDGEILGVSQPGSAGGAGEHGIVKPPADRGRVGRERGGGADEGRERRRRAVIGNPELDVGKHGHEGGDDRREVGGGELV